MPKIVIEITVGNEMIAGVIENTLTYQMRELKKANPLIQDFKTRIED